MRSDRTFSDTGGDLSSDDNSTEFKDVHKAVMREYRQIKLSIQKNEYPLDLKKTVHLLSGGYMDVVKHEQQKPNRNVHEDMKDFINDQGLALLALKLKTSNEIIQATLDQWRMFHKEKDQWMGNITLTFEKRIESYLNLNTVGLKLIARSVQGVTWNRT